jgi:hypothetical protein
MSNSKMSSQCPVCRNMYANKYLKRRHMGAIHGIDENLRAISIERRKYLKHQSDRKYIRNMDRQNADNQPTTPTTITTSQHESIDNMSLNGQNGGQVEPMESRTTLEYHMQSDDRSDDKSDVDRLFRQMFSECWNAYNRVCMRKKKKSSPPAYRPTKVPQWTTY